MYDFNFILGTGPDAGTALSAARECFLKAFPDNEKVKIVSTQVMVIVQAGKIAGTQTMVWSAILTFDSPEELRPVDISRPVMMMKPIKE
jgi:hypothetical protein